MLDAMPDAFLQRPELQDKLHIKTAISYWAYTSRQYHKAKVSNVWSFLSTWRRRETEHYVGTRNQIWTRLIFYFTNAAIAYSLLKSLKHTVNAWEIYISICIKLTSTAPATIYTFYQWAREFEISFKMLK